MRPGSTSSKTLRADGSTSKAEQGEFQADVSLTAYFGGDKVAVASQDRIEGKVTNFRDGSVSLSGWTVTLQQQELDTNDNLSSWAGMTEGSAGSDEGAWSGKFYGSGTDADDDPTGPSGAAGEFNAHFTNGHVNGAYGATKK